MKQKLLKVILIWLISFLLAVLLLPYLIKPDYVVAVIFSIIALLPPILLWIIISSLKEKEKRFSQRFSNLCRLYAILFWASVIWFFVFGVAPMKVSQIAKDICAIYAVVFLILHYQEKKLAKPKTLKTEKY